MAKKAEIMTVLGWDDSAMVRGVAKASNLVTGLSKKLANLGTGAIGGTFKGLAFFNQAAEGMQKLMVPAQKLGELMLNSMGKAADMEQTQVAFKTLVGSAEGAQKVLQELVTLGAQTPFEFPELATAGRMLIAFGEDSSTVAESLRRVGDVASGITAPIGEIAEIYGKVRVQNQLFAEDINQFQGRGIPLVAELAKITGRSATEVKKLASEGKITFPFMEQVFINLTSKGGKFFDMMKEQSGTVKGKISNLADAFTGMQIEFAKPINESLKPLLDAVTNYIATIKADSTEIGKIISGWVDYITGAFQSGLGLEALWLDMKIGFTKVAAFFGKALSDSIPGWMKDWYENARLAAIEWKSMGELTAIKLAVDNGVVTKEEAVRRVKDSAARTDEAKKGLKGKSLDAVVFDLENQRWLMEKTAKAAFEVNKTLADERAADEKFIAEGKAKSEAAGLKSAMSGISRESSLTGAINNTIRQFAMRGSSATEMNEIVLRKQLKSRAENIKTQLGSRMGDTNYPGAKAFEGLRSELKLIREQVISIGSGTRGGLLGFSEGHSS